VTTMTQATWGLLLSLLALAPLSGCAADDTNTTTTDLRCAEETRALPYTPGMSVDSTDGIWSLTLIDASPAPPDKGNNDWLVELEATGSTTPVDGATMTVQEFMPDHGHGAPPPPPLVTPTADPGRYTIENINLWMPGYWEVRIDVDSDSTTDRVIFPFCIEG